MSRLFVVVEGQTEKGFVDKVLGPHLSARGVYTSASIVGKTLATRRRTTQRGGGSYLSGWQPDMRRLLASDTRDDVRVSTLFDLYGLPNDFPGLDSGVPTVSGKVEALERAMADDINDWRFIPFLMKYEFEALVLAALPSLKLQFSLPSQLEGITNLERSIGTTPPEDVNDGPTTAPSKRLLSYVPGYQKTVHGPTALAEVGLQRLRSACPRFSEWVGRLETLS